MPPQDLRSAKKRKFSAKIFEISKKFTWHGNDLKCLKNGEFRRFFDVFNVLLACFSFICHKNFLKSRFLPIFLNFSRFFRFFSKKCHFLTPLIFFSFFDPRGAVDRPQRCQKFNKIAKNCVKIPPLGL